jgi:hypothetical protein
VSKQEEAIATMRLLTLVTSTAVKPSLSKAQITVRQRALTVPAPGEVVHMPRPCWNCGDRLQLRCCEYGRDSLV